MSDVQFDFEANMAKITEITEKEHAEVEAQEKLAVDMVGIHGRFSEEGADPDKLHAEFHTLRHKRDAHGRQQELYKQERERLETLAADHAVIKSSKAGKGSDVPLMKLSDALGMLVQSKEQKAGADKLTSEQVDLARKSIEASGVKAEEIGGTTIRFHFENMTVATRDGNNSTISFEDAEPTHTRDTYVDRLQAYGGALEAVGVIVTENGNSVEWPNVDYLSKIARKRTEGANQLSDASVAEPDHIVTRPYIIDTGVIPVSNQTIRDIPASVTALVMRQLDRMVGVLINNEITTGTGDGNGDSQGLINGAVDRDEGRITSASGAVSADYTDFVDMIFSVDAAYRRQDYGTLQIGDVRGGRICFQMHDTVLKSLYNMRDGENRPLWLPNVRGGSDDPGTILGRDIVINQSLAQWAAPASGTTTYPLLFGNFDYYQARFTADGSYSETYSDSPYASQQKTGFQQFSEMCGCYIGGFSSGNNCEAVVRLPLYTA